MSVIVGVEGQNDPNPGYPLVKRAAYYLATMVTAQKGREFNKNYGEMKKTYSIWCVLDPRVADRNTIVRYRMKGERIYGGKENNPQELDAFNIIMINMGKYSDELPDALAIGTAMFSLMEKDARRELVDKKFNLSMTDTGTLRLFPHWRRSLSRSHLADLFCCYHITEHNCQRDMAKWYQL